MQHGKAVETSVLGHSRGQSSLIGLDHDSLSNILSYCPNRASYELQSMKLTCRTWNLLLSGMVVYESKSSMKEISKGVKESIGNSDLLNRIEEMYIPRLYFSIFIPLKESPARLPSERGEEGTILSVIECYCREFENIFGKPLRRISDSELEIDFDLDDTFLFDKLEKIIHKTITIPKKENLPHYLLKKKPNHTDEEAQQLFHVVKKENQQEQKLKEHITLVDLYSKWKSEPILEKDMKINPFRLANKFIQHLSFEDAYGPKVKRFSQNIPTNSSVYCSYLICGSGRDEINFYKGCIHNNFKKIYQFLAHDEKYYKNSLLILYYLLRHKLIPRMEVYSIDLQQLFEKNILKLWEKRIFTTFLL